MDQDIAPLDPSDFDEQGYLDMNPDVAAAICNGNELSGWNHYLHHGHKEGRRATPFDEPFYLRAYPVVQQELAEGRAASPFEHYKSVGRGRGYLPHARASRGSNPSGSRSAFGGLWIDQPHVHDLIEGKLAVGLIDEDEAKQLRFFVKNGYIILKKALTAGKVAAARADLMRAFQGGFPELKFECGTLSREGLSWKQEINQHPAKALDIHHVSSAIRAIMFSPKIAAFLGLIFESKSFASQTLGFLRGSAQEGHQDSAYVVYTLPRQFAASWIALEDVTPGAGELFYYAGSHRLPDFLYGGAFKSVSEATRMGTAPEILDREIREHVAALDTKVRGLGLKKEVFAARAGDALIWHSDLVHGGSPVSQAATRMSVVTHYCPKFAAPAFSEHMAITLSEQDGHYYTTSHY